MILVDMSTSGFYRNQTTLSAETQRNAFKLSNIALEIKPIFLAFHRTGGAETILAKESAQ